MKRVEIYRWVKTASVCLFLATTIFAKAESRLKPVSANSSGVTFSLTGDAGSTFTVLTSTNLIDWVPLFTGVMAGGTTNLVDHSIANRKFYRALTSTPQRPPINVTPQLSPDQTNSTLLTPVGATLIIFHPDATQITLYVPTNSIVVDQPLVITQVTNLVDLPFSGGLLAAVQIAPDTLDLFGAALLKFPIPPSIDRRHLVSFTCGNDGSDLRLKEDRILSNEVAIVITKPGIYGTAIATTDDVAYVAQNVLTPRALWGASGTALLCFPSEVIQTRLIDNAISDKESNLDRDIEKTLSDQRQSQLLGYDEDPAPTTAEMISRKCDFFTQNVAPNWQAAANNCTLTTALLQKTLGYDRGLQLFGVPDNENCAAPYLNAASLCASFAHCRSNILECCLAGNQGWGRVMDAVSMARQIALMGIDGTPGCFQLFDDEFMQTLFACTNLVWYGTFSFDGSTNWSSRLDYPGGGFAEQTDSVSTSFMGVSFGSTEQGTSDGILVSIKVAGPLTIRSISDSDIEIPGKCGTSHQISRGESSVTSEAIYAITLEINDGQPQYGIQASLLPSTFGGNDIYCPDNTQYDNLTTGFPPLCSGTYDSHTDSSQLGPVAGPSLVPIEYPFGPNQVTNVVSGSTNGPYAEFTIDPMPVKFNWHFIRSTNQPPVAPKPPTSVIGTKY